MTVRTHSPLVRIVPFLVAVCLFNLPTQARYSGGSGTADDPYQIATAADLMALGRTPTDYDRHFVLTADIDLDPKLPAAGSSTGPSSLQMPTTLTTGFKALLSLACSMATVTRFHI